MLEGSGDSSPSAQEGKRRRLQGACDVCRRKKGNATMPGNKCTNCIAFHYECTHARFKHSASETRTPSVAKPKTGQQIVAEILSVSAVYIPSNNPTVCHQILVSVALYARTLEEKLASLQPGPLTLAPNSGSPVENRTPSSDPDLKESTVIMDPLTHIISREPTKLETFYGKSSSIQFIKAAIKYMHGNTARVVGVQRPEFWIAQPWDKVVVQRPQHVFPDDDLLQALVTIYFEQINPIIGILHSPSFLQSIADGLHVRDADFGAVVLVVCAMASRFSDDLRVYLEGTGSKHSAGWKWFRQVRPLRTSFSVEPSLHRLQLICLSVVFMGQVVVLLNSVPTLTHLRGTSTPEESWILVGLGIRLAQSAGVHLRTGYSGMHPLDAELYKRAFWILLISDSIMSSFKGRPNSMQPADFDIDLPVDCDEEYWGIPGAVQPPGKPSNSSFFIAYFKLLVIFGRIQGAIYPVNGQMSSEDAVVQLDSELNNWAGMIPDHLRWDPHQDNQIFLDQSTALYVVYYHGIMTFLRLPIVSLTLGAAQILIHRPLIPAPGKKSTQLSRPSCANAARSCGHVLDVQARRGRGLLHHPHVMTVLFESAVVLLINVWDVVGGRHSLTLEDFNRATSDSQNCVRVLRLYERRWRFAGRKGDIISALINMGKSTAAAPSLKRPRDSQNVVPPPDILIEPSEGRRVAGSSRMSMSRQMQELHLATQETSLFSLPLHTEELGRLPVYESFDYDFTFQSNGIPGPSPSYSSSPYDQAGPIDLDFLMGLDLSSVGEISQDDGLAVSGIEPPHSLVVPSGYNWSDWRAYLASMDVLNQDTMEVSRGRSLSDQ
ncbi:fungal-specific transcription factor domain-containing protein [Mycena galericulata]|nr:fungal-specific transcription factor domain-containing protein [Mycena galericulata]